MAKSDVERLLIAGGENETTRARYDAAKTMEDFVALARHEGYLFNKDELMAVLNESGDSFDLTGNPPKRQIWWK